ncbi:MULTISPECIES: nucleoside deaminase [Amycolatopsis]|uniref:nucleoside deaminase n=1 Tax=Amycolatopsis TaxID=1813 RepID=UPI0003AAD83B|nr:MULTISPECIES: nucleoside deaminase [Amycolatopsis]MCG3751502.1 nucleoside deaminase [Amycolatopsis sp. Poz14]
MTVSIDADVERAWLAECVRIAEKNVADGGGPFGALVVKDGEIVATGVNRVTPSLDPTAHAEVVAIRAACQALGTFSLAGCVLVSSCEPCPMCLASSLWARVDRVLYTADRDDAARAGFDDRAFYELFENPRETWQTPVSRVSTPEAFAPFSAWLNRSDRIEY